MKRRKLVCHYDACEYFFACWDVQHRIVEDEDLHGAEAESDPCSTALWATAFAQGSFAQGTAESLDDFF